MNNTAYIAIEQSPALNGTVELIGAKNAVLVIISSLLLTNGKSRLSNVPASDDVMQMIALMQTLGAEVFFHAHEHVLEVDTSAVNKWQISAEIMKKMRASILAMGPLLARFGKADVALPGGCSIGQRPIDYHLKNFKKMGVDIDECGDYVSARAQLLQAARIVLEYPSVGATENILMAATLTHGITTIINAALEPEVMDLISIVRKMGAKIIIEAPATIIIEGVSALQPVEHAIIPDRLEAGALLLAAAITGGTVSLPQAHAYSMDVFLMKLEEMGHQVIIGPQGIGVALKATNQPKAVSFKTAPYPGFPTDLQAPMMAALCLAEGTSIIEETVFENRLLHVHELQKMGAQIKVEHNKAIVHGVDKLYGASVIATDIRASCALVLTGLAAHGNTIMTGIHHWRRGYEGLEHKLSLLGGLIKLYAADEENAILYTKPEIISEQIQTK
jgi:UDP-N-acetylglucosamine 1-carboxyvinyltransferase